MNAVLLAVRRSDAEGVKSGFERSTAEAISSFGDGRMLVEKYIENGHHIEIQVMDTTEMTEGMKMVEEIGRKEIRRGSGGAAACLE